MKTLIVGFGSPFGDDQLGWQLIDDLASRHSASHLTFYKSKGNGCDWFHELANHQQLVILDAALSEKPAGNIIEMTVNDLKNIPSHFFCSTHSISLQDSLALATNIGVLNIPVRILAISIGNKEIAANSNWLTSQTAYSILKAFEN
ncbi:MAG TPA: hydrogenase maturation protease [Gammaproteobacteria bacterium]|nr:hydrogenase maturation protease [Gammaproteobacteria bacterium]